MVCLSLNGHPGKRRVIDIMACCKRPAIYGNCNAVCVKSREVTVDQTAQCQKFTGTAAVADKIFKIGIQIQIQSRILCAELIDKDSIRNDSLLN